MLATLRHRLVENFVRWAVRVRTPEPSPIILTQRRVYVLPTLAGLSYGTALIVILLGAMNYNLSLGHALVFLLAGLGVVAAVAAYFADFPPFRRHGITRRPRLRVSRADLRGHDWPATPAQHDELAAALAAQEQRYLAAMAAGDRYAAGPVAAALCEPVLIRWHHRDRSSPDRARVPGGNCRPGRRKLHVMPDGSLHPCERTGDVMPIGDVATGIRPSRVQQLQEDFHGAVSARCAQCWAVRGCGLCFASQASSAGRANATTIPVEVCDASRRSREQQLKLVARALLLPSGVRSWLDATNTR